MVSVRRTIRVYQIAGDHEWPILSIKNNDWIDSNINIEVKVRLYNDRLTNVKVKNIKI